MANFSFSRRFAPVALGLALALGAGCDEQTVYQPAPSDRFFYPSGLAIRHVKPGTNDACDAGTVGVPSVCQTQLYVSSANSDLRYQSGTLMALDVDQAFAKYQPSVEPQPITAVGADGIAAARLGVHTIGNYSGEVALVDGTSCPGYDGGAQALVPSGAETKLYRFEIDTDGGLSCGSSDCSLALHGPQTDGVSTLDVQDPYGVSVACGMLPDDDGNVAQRNYAFVGYLSVAQSKGGLSRFELTDSTSELTWIDLGIAPARSMAYDPDSTRLYISERFAAVGTSPVRWLTLATPTAGYDLINMEDLVRGSEPLGIALSSDKTRAYVAVTLYDVSTATTTGSLPSTDLGGALAVLDLSLGTDGQPTLDLIKLVSLDRGATQVAVIPRSDTSLRDTVAVISTDDGTMSLYDDSAGAIVDTFGLCGMGDDASSDPPRAGDQYAPAPCWWGEPTLGVSPFGLVVESLDTAADYSGRALARLYVASFDRSWVNVITIDRDHPEQGPTSLVRPDQSQTLAPWMRIGPRRW